MKKGVTASNSFKKDSILDLPTQKLAKEFIPGDSNSRNLCKPTPGVLCTACDTVRAHSIDLFLDLLLWSSSLPAILIFPIKI